MLDGAISHRRISPRPGWRSLRRGDAKLLHDDWSTNLARRKGRRMDVEIPTPALEVFLLGIVNGGRAFEGARHVAGSAYLNWSIFFGGQPDI